MIPVVKVKICGNRSRDDLVASRGADAVGFIVSTPESPRNIEPEHATRISESVQLFTSITLVTTEKDPLILKQLTERVKPDYLQLHSELSPREIEGINSEMDDNVSLIGLITVDGPPGKVKRRARKLSGAQVEAVLLDSRDPDRAGGTGKTHDWKISREVRDALYPFPVILAGGLGPNNVGKAIREVRPSCVDVATGVEQDGKKSERKVRRFLEEVNKIGT